MTSCSVQITRSTGARRKRQPAIDWRHELPKEWRRLVVVPLTIERFRDYEMAAERFVGRDEDEQACYCSSRFVVMETRSDDDEEFYQIAAYAESIKAWRLRDSRWLIYREIKHEGEKGSTFFSIGESMPR